MRDRVKEQSWAIEADLTVSVNCKLDHTDDEELYIAESRIVLQQRHQSPTRVVVSVIAEAGGREPGYNIPQPFSHPIPASDRDDEP